MRVEARGDRHPPLTPEAIAVEIENAWLRICDWPEHMGPARVCMTRRGRVLVGAEGDRYSYAVEVGTFTRAITLCDLRAEVYHVWESMQR